MKKLLIAALLIFILYGGCAKDNTGISEGLPVRLEITAKVWNKLQRQNTAVPGAVIELLSLNRGYINGQKFRKVAGNSGTIVFETDSNILCANKTYLIVGSHPTSQVILETEQEFTMPRLPNLGNRFYIQTEFIFDRID